ncbi:hypothetical protein DPMN_030059 [Dreissena polymorpha]|uniref:Uncharacterized protein n=1 Tax=Dreissena polymorpha TaxID=45954 RepID=A0A9D4M1Y1_DREPO|nr:hypothetical protein DPMN_030059 [Dreissena polymorpha]
MHLMKWFSKKSLKTYAFDQRLSDITAAVPGEQPNNNSGMSRFPGKTKYFGKAWPPALPQPMSVTVWPLPEVTAGGQLSALEIILGGCVHK